MQKLPAEQVASMLNVELRTLRNWEAEGTGPKRVMENRKPCYPVKHLRAWLRVNRPDLEIAETKMTAAQRDEARAERKNEREWAAFADKYERSINAAKRKARVRKVSTR